MRPIAVFGAGGFAREVRWLIEDLAAAGAPWVFSGYVVRDPSHPAAHESVTELTAEDEWLERAPEGAAAALGLGDPALRLRLGQLITQRRGDDALPALVHPSIRWQAASCRVEPGVTLCAGNIATVDVVFCRYSMVNLSCTIGHEAIIGEGSCLNPTVNVSGGVEMGRGVLVGTGAQILQYVKIGDAATIGAGAVVTKDVPPGATVVGVPAKPLSRA
ncbi:MAG: acetyltransferase [Acidobacteriota bacterium]|nr:acetyltransferase [Acidobacteriota bacterium]